MNIPTEQQIRKDNKHFGPFIRIVEDMQPYENKTFKGRFTHSITFGSKDTQTDMVGEIIIIDAWATYLYDQILDRWVLWANYHSIEPLAWR